MPKKRVRPVNKERERMLKINPNSLEFKEIKAKLSPRLRAGWHIFENIRHIHTLQLDRDFFSSLKPNTKVLEIGAGTGRLADYLLKNSKLRPENYEIMDKRYGEKEMPFLRKKIFLLMKKRRIKVTKANMWEHGFKKNAYNHILIPEGFFASSEITKKMWKPGMSTSARDELLIETVTGLVGKLGRALKQNGTLRISYIWPEILEEIEKRNLFHGFKVTIKTTSIILQKV
ncbi:MAG: hypothetical protein Q7S21_04290 [archaeon]|nr:hypothetical protein [archaeon]